MIIIRWFISKTVRHAVAMRRHVRKLLNHQRDVLKPDEIKHIEFAISDLGEAIRNAVPVPVLKTQIARLESVASEKLRPYPNPVWRENVEVLLVALAVAMGIRTFFLQPFKIPTGSMQPTLYGVTSENLRGRTDVVIPTGWSRVREWFGGNSYMRFTAERDGQLNRIEPPTRILIFNIKQRIWFGGKAHTLWFPPDYGAMTLEDRTEVKVGDYFRAGQDIIRLRVRSGDHLFVDRLTYNFRPPSRGEIVVFETKGIDALPQDQFYIKRLVALGGDSIQIGKDQHLTINFTNRLDAGTPHFEFVYGFDTNSPPRDSHFSGHVNRATALKFYPEIERRRLPDGFVVTQQFAPLFDDANTTIKVPPTSLMVMGDNTMNSSDGRFWGTFPARNVIGRSCFVYWPLSERFGGNSLRY